MTKRLRAQRVSGLTIGMLLAASTLAAQEEGSTWQRKAPSPDEVPLFHSESSLHLPTAQTLGEGEIGFEILHRFLPPISSGSNGLWGFDGPVNIRFGLTYAPTDRLMLSLGRSNRLDNYDLQAKARVYEAGGHDFAFSVALVGGLAWNTEVPGRDDGDALNWQYYGEVVLNALFSERFGIGVVPAYLNNPVVEDLGRDDALSLGLYAHYYANAVLGLIAEYNISDFRAELPYDSFALGFHLETGGHFFKILVTNTTSLNPSQYLAGSTNEITSDELRLGFNVTRVF